jgi:archaellum component FlaG (FlaF/FlaG flagellin family)
VREAAIFFIAAMLVTAIISGVTVYKAIEYSQLAD